MKFKLWLEDLNRFWYHGSRKPIEEILSATNHGFGGLHLGTKKAAEERLDNTPSQRVGGIPGHEKIYKFSLHLTRPFNSPENPMSEHDLFMLRADKQEMTKMRHKYDGLYYINNIEDKGSISVVVFDASKVTYLSMEKY